MWPVLTEYDLVLLQVVRRSYCGDAYMNSNGALQVASFISEQKAQNFAHLLSVTFMKGVTPWQPFRRIG